MPRLQPLPPETTPELKAHFDFFLGTLGFTPNSVLTMQRKPKLVQAFAQLNGAVMDPAGEVDLHARRHQENLWATADKLRANMDAAEYKHLVLGLIFVKYISDTFAARRAELTTRASPTRQTTTSLPTPRPPTCSRAGRPRLLQRGQRLLGARRPPAGKACAPPPSSPTLASASTMR
jgi:hypothetical protein